MKTSQQLFQTLQFQGEWRTYQQRILQDLDSHLTDDKLHVVAAPGAGKTILGLEIIRRLAKPCLILAPTITIKNQWALRLKQAFMTDKSLAEEMISLNILSPKTITLSTYQGLLAGLCGQQEKKQDTTEQEETEPEEKNSQKEISLKRLNPAKAEALIKILKKANIQVLCFDEAHHLRKEWWKALDYLIETLAPKKTLSLTATPPYDVEYGEWQRYESLCGPVDAEISIPELVKHGDLCPHQDLLYFASLKNTEAESYKAYQQTAQEFLSSFLSNTNFAEELFQLDIWKKPDEYMELFFEDPEFYIACASFLKFHEKELPKAFLKLFETTQKDLPSLTNTQVNFLLNGFLFKYRQNYTVLEPYLEAFYSEAKTKGLIYNQEICIDSNPKITKLMTYSLGKLDAIVDIATQEEKTLKSNLRMVILTSFIRYDYLNSDKESLGVIPIFKRLSALSSKNIRLGVLTGKIILIPKELLSAFRNLATQYKLKQENISFRPLKINPNYLEVRATGNLQSKIVFLVTELFNQGSLTILIGTQALLGEGWDAPAINSIILSDTVASYMLSNQMRGRAIRIDKTNPNKISHIWHLANIKVFTPWAQLRYGTPHICGDLPQLQRRFQGYQAPLLDAPYTIQNGIERCYLNQNRIPTTEIDFHRITDKSLNYTRAETKKAWDLGLISADKSGFPHLKSEITTRAKNKIYFTDGYAIKLCMASSIAAELSITCVKAKQPWLLLPIWLIWSLFMAPSTWHVLRSGKPQGYLKQISMVILESLFACDAINTNPKNIHVNVQPTPSAHHSITLEHIDDRDRNIFLRALREFLEPIDNPRYLLVRKNILTRLLKQTDYHAVPSMLANNKKTVMLFKKFWQRRIGACNVFYTRNVFGHRLLLRAKMKAYSHLNDQNKQNIRWG